MVKEKVREVGVLEAARLLGRRLDSTYKLIWEQKLEARKEAATGKWLVSVPSIYAFKRASEKRRSHRTRLRPRLATPVPAAGKGITAEAQVPA